ncbi:MAG: hypothetical protein O6932_00655, partial [Gammaproteobacteria bacterium]|nr:hypothetical protein [Gammaproteobacteria bacterium]
LLFVSGRFIETREVRPILCEHLKNLHTFVKENEIGGLDMIKIVCKKCHIQHECPEISTEYWQSVEMKESQDKKKRVRFFVMNL